MIDKNQLFHKQKNTVGLPFIKTAIDLRCHFCRSSHVWLYRIIQYTRNNGKKNITEVNCKNCNQKYLIPFSDEAQKKIKQQFFQMKDTIKNKPGL